MNIFDELINPKNFNAVFDRLRTKASKDPHRRQTSPVIKSISLNWVLNSEKYLTKKIITEIKKHNYRPGIAAKNAIHVKNKKREIFSLAWPDKIVEAVLAEALNRAVEHSYTDSLFSFRRGKSNLNALERLSNYIQKCQQAELPVYIFRTDIVKYGESIDTTLLTEMIKSQIPEQTDFFWQLLAKFIEARYQNRLTLDEVFDDGLPAGFSITPVCENIYLTDIDHQMLRHESLYLRFGDDLLLADYNPERLIQNKSELINLVTQKKLQTHPLKTSLLAFHHTHPEFQYKQCFDYLGYSINHLGQLFLSTNKLKELKTYYRNKINICFHTIRRKESDPLLIIKNLCSATKELYHPEYRHPYLNLLLAHSNDPIKIKALDTWVASQIIKKVYKYGGSKAFRKIPYNQLRDWQLPSLLHLSRLKRRGQDAN